MCLSFDTSPHRKTDGVFYLNTSSVLPEKTIRSRQIDGVLRIKRWFISRKETMDCAKRSNSIQCYVNRIYEITSLCQQNSNIFILEAD